MRMLSRRRQEEEQAQPEDEETNEGGLWHKVVWKRAQAEFAGRTSR